MKPTILALVVGTMVLITACGDSDPVDPNIPRAELAGSYQLTQLQFNPQGSLPAVDLKQRIDSLGKPMPSLTLHTDGTLQLFFQEPGSTHLRLVNGTFRTTTTGAVLDLGDNAAFYRTIMLSRHMTFTRHADNSLGFAAEAPNGVQKESLFVLVPEWSGEPLVDPVPGQLNVTFARQ